MKRLLLGLILATGTFVAGAPAVRADDSDYTTKETRALMHAYAQCVVRRQGKKASEAVLANVDNGIILRKYPMLIIGDCLARKVNSTTSMSFSGDLYRYALADALVKSEFADQQAPDLSAVPRLEHRQPSPPPPNAVNLATGKKLSKKQLEEAQRDYAAGVAYSFLSKYGECVVRTAPTEAKGLLLTIPDSSEETLAFKALQLGLSTCLAPGETLKFGRVALRGTIAINYYRLAHAARSAATRAPS